MRAPESIEGMEVSAGARVFSFSGQKLDDRLPKNCHSCAACLRSIRSAKLRRDLHLRPEFRPPDGCGTDLRIRLAETEDAEDFLELTAEERSLVELRLAVSRAVRARRLKSKLTQSEVARKLKTSQPNVCKMESGSRDVSLDQMFRAFFALGGKSKEVLLLK
jgi:hypothetical protein